MRLLFSFSLGLIILSVFSLGYMNFSDMPVNKSAGDSSDKYNNQLSPGPNFRIFPGSFLQVEISAYTNPLDSAIRVASAITNFQEGGYSTGFYISTNNGVNWTGTDHIDNFVGTTITTIGDPTIIIDHNGRFILPYIAPSLDAGIDFKVGASYSTNNGASWSPTVYVPGIDTADKPISISDNMPLSPYIGRSYIVYDELNSTEQFTKGVFFSSTTNSGVTWDVSKRITNINPLYRNRLVAGISIGVAGEVYVCWYTGPSDIGFSKSTNAGVNWVINNDTAIPTDSSTISYMFDSLFLQGIPAMDIDKSGGSRNGWIYVADLETYSDSLDIVIHRSSNGGSNWAFSNRVNQDITGSFRIQVMPAINIDRYGGVNIFYYDTRNSGLNNDSFEVYLSRSVDGGNNFEDLKISDHKFKFAKPAIPLFYIDGYIGSYIGVSSGKDKINPVWYDNSTGHYQAWTSSLDLIPDFEIKVIPEGLYDTLSQRLRIKDTIKIYLRTAIPPYTIVDSSAAVIDSVSFNASVKFHPNLLSGNYFLEITHRNSIETWSAASVTYNFGSKVFYDFTLTSGSAYGSNLKFVKNKWCIYSGDVNQDGVIDLTDLISVLNASNIFLTGYVPQDCTGDFFVDLSDLIITYNNAKSFITVIRPF